MATSDEPTYKGGEFTIGGEKVYGPTGASITPPGKKSKITARVKGYGTHDPFTGPPDDPSRRAIEFTREGDNILIGPDGRKYHKRKDGSWYSSEGPEGSGGEHQRVLSDVMGLDETEKETTGETGGSGGTGGTGGGGVARTMGYKAPTVTPGVPDSETERVDTKHKFGTPFAESIRDSMVGEVKGLGKRSEDLAAIDRERDFNNAILAQAQQFAAKGMSFSQPMLHAEEDMIRDLAKERLIDADEAATLQKKLDMARWEAAEPIMRLAAEARLGDPGTGLDFTPGAFSERLLDLDIGSVPRGEVKRSGGSSGSSKKDEEKDDISPTSHYTDGKGDVCYYEETSVDEDGVRTCPGTTVGGGEGPMGGDVGDVPGSTGWGQ
jgi:hypothetical protein